MGRAFRLDHRQIFVAFTGRRMKKRASRGSVPRRDAPSQPAGRASRVTPVEVKEGTLAVRSQGAAMLAAARVLLAGALAVAVFLGIRSLQGAQTPGCTEGCDEVLGSRWAYAWGIPVSLPGALVYAAVLALSFRPVPQERRWAGWMARSLEVGVLLGAAWFVFLQAGVVRAFCPWCTGCHLAASTGVVLLAHARARQQGVSFPEGARRQWLPAPAVLAVAGLAGLALAQRLGPVPRVARTVNLPTTGGQAAVTVGLATNGPSGAGGVASGGSASSPSPAQPRVSPVVRLFNGKFTVKADDYPTLGPASATNVVVGLFDYTCSHCRHMHGELERFQADTSHPPFQIVELPVALRQESLELQRVMLTTWQADPAVYRRISKELWSERLPARAQPVLALANDLLGTMVYSSARATHEKWINEALLLAQSVRQETQQAAGAKTLPQLIVGSRVIEGVMDGPTLRSNLLRAAGLPGADNLPGGR